MSRDLNQCNFIGRLGNDPELKSLPSGNAVCNVSIAVGDDYKDKNSGQKVEVTEWVRLVSFGALADVMGKYLKKGSKVYISGKMKTRTWEKDGQKQYSTEIVADNMQMLDSKPQESGQTNNAGYQNQQYGSSSTNIQPQHQSRENQSPSAPSNFDDFDNMDVPF